ncbi:hypothetical protein AB4508_23450 [Vibrio splendidus]
MDEFLSKDTAAFLNGLANMALVGSLVIGAASTAIVIWTGSMKESYLTKELSEANLKAETAKESAAVANAETTLNKARVEQLNLEANNAKIALAETQIRLAKMQELRRLSKDTIVQLCDHIKASELSTNREYNLRVSSVADSESQMYAMDFLSLFKSCGVNIYPTPGGVVPNEIIQLEASDTGLELVIGSNVPEQPFSDLVQIMERLGIEGGLRIDSSLPAKSAVLQVLRKPNS